VVYVLSFSVHSSLAGEGISDHTKSVSPSECSSFLWHDICYVIKIVNGRTISFY
jgi:hypothetical protein